MTDEEKCLRKIIRETLSNEDSKIAEQLLTEDKINPICTWWLYEHFGIEILKKAGVTTGAYEIVYAVKKELEEKEGWRFQGWKYDRG